MTDIDTANNTNNTNDTDKAKSLWQALLDNREMLGIEFYEKQKLVLMHSTATCVFDKEGLEELINSLTEFKNRMV